MQTCLLILVIILAGQVADPAGDRYGQVLPPATTDNAGAMPFSPEQHSFAQPSDADPSKSASQPLANPLRSSIPPASTSTTATPPAGMSAAAAPPATTAPTRPAAPASRLTKVVKPADLLKSLVKPVGQQQLSGTPLSLSEAVQNSRSREEQTRRVNLYWDLSRLVSSYYLAALEEIQLQSQLSGLAQASEDWSAALETVASRKRVAYSAVRVAQLRLQNELGRLDESTLPLPSDLPHCGAYETKFDEIFRGRTSREAQQLADLLPLRHQQLIECAAGRSESLQWYNRVSQQRSVQSDAVQLLKAYEQLALHRRAFVAAAYEYNANIARYTELAVPQDVGSVRLVAMLIQTTGDSTANWQSGAIQRATAEQAPTQSNPARSSVDQSNIAERYPPRTYAEGGRNETRRVPADKPTTNKSRTDKSSTDRQSGERSIVVQPGAVAK